MHENSNLLTGLLQNGFSVAVAIYLLVRMEQRLNDLTKAIYDLKNAITLNFKKEGEKSAP